MTGVTTNFALPYPDTTDAPCDFAEQWCDFTAAIDGVFGTWQTAVNRTVPVIPAALMLRTTPISVLNTNQVPFESVLVDTASMTDMESDPFNITIRRAGRYTIAGFIILASPAIAVNAEMSLIISGDLRTIVAENQNRGGFDYRINAYRAAFSALPGDQVHMSFNVGTNISVSVPHAWLGVAWHSDTETP